MVRLGGYMVLAAVVMMTATVVGAAAAGGVLAAAALAACLKHLARPNSYAVVLGMPLTAPRTAGQHETRAFQRRLGQRGRRYAGAVHRVLGTPALAG